jgi:Ion transport protein
LAEAFIKIIAISPKVYFNESWNTFDFVIIMGSFFSIFISANTSLEIRGAITIMRSFRILRLLRLIKRGKSLQLIFNTLIITVHSLANIGALLLLFIFMFSILGMILFGDVQRNGIMNDYINFENFWNAYLTLFIVGTGDSWNDIMSAFTIENSPAYQCMDNPTYDDYVNIGNNSNVGCGNLGLSWAYFVSYMFIVNLVFLKIFIAIILQGYDDT